MRAKRIISTILALTMVFSVMLSSVSCDEFLNELLEDPEKETEYDGGYTGIVKKTTEKKTEEITEEFTEDNTVPEWPTEWPSEWPTEIPTVRPPEYTTEEDTYPIGCSHCECAWTGGCHYCEFCGEKRWDCKDDNNDHRCDGCGDLIENCKDNNNDYVCDICGEKLEIPGLKAAGKGMCCDDAYFENGTNMTPTGAANVWFANNRGKEGATGVDSIGFHGWAMYIDGKEVAIEAFGWSLLKNCEEMSDIIWDGEVIIDENLFAPLGGAVETRRYIITIDCTELETAEYDVYLYVKFANGEIYQLDAWSDIWVNHVNEYMTKSASATAQDDIDAGYAGSILSESALPFSVFDKGNGIIAGDGGLITTTDYGTAVWKFNGGFGDYFTEATGKYAYTLVFESVNMTSGGGLVRGWDQGFTGWDPGYIGAAGSVDANIPHTTAHGKAGIYYYVSNVGELVFVIKGWNENNHNIPAITTIKVPNCSGHITALDLGDVIYFKSEDKTVAKVELVGSVMYGDITAPMTEKAIVTTWDGQKVEIDKALINANLVGSHFGITSRIVQMEISAVSYGSAAGIEYAANLDVATSIATDKAVYSEGEFIYVAASHKEAAYVGIYKAGTTDLIAYYEMGTADGFADIPAGDYDVVLCDMAVNILKSVTIKVTPASIIASYGAADLAARTNDPFGATFGCTPILSGDGTYVTLTMDANANNPAIGGPQGTDYNWYVAFPGVYDMPASNYMVIKYRTTATNIDKQELFLGTGTISFGGAGSNIQFIDKMVCDGEWNYLYINFEEYGVTDMNTLQILRFDFINGAPSGSTIDIQYINFYKTAEDAYKSTWEPLVFQNPSDYAQAQTVMTKDQAGFGAILNAIEAVNGESYPDGIPAINGSDLLWLSGPEATIDLSKYSKAVITFTMDAGPGTQASWEANEPNNMFEILCFSEVLAQGAYTLPSSSWMWNTCEIDLTGITHNGEVLFRLTNEGLPGSWYAIHSIVLVP